MIKKSSLGQEVHEDKPEIDEGSTFVQVESRHVVRCQEASRLF